MEREAINVLNASFSLDREDPNHRELFDYLSRNNVPVPERLPAGLEGTPAIGCKVLKVHDNVVELEHGKPLIFANGKKGVRLVGNHLEVVSTDDVPADDLLIHDEKDPNPSIHMMLARMVFPAMPEPIGVLRAVEGVTTYDDQINDQVEQATRVKGEGDLDKLFHAGDTWQVD